MSGINGYSGNASMQASQPRQAVSQARITSSGTNNVSYLPKQSVVDNRQNLQNLSSSEHAPSFLNRLLSAYQTGSTFGVEQRARDKAAGQGVVKGASTLNNRMQNAQFAKILAGSLSIPGEQSPLEAFGSAAQQWQIQQLQNQAIAYGLKQFGVETTGLSAAELTNAGLKYLGVGPATQTATTGVSLGTDAATGIAIGAESSAANGVKSAAGLVDDGVAVGGQILSAAGAIYSGYQLIDSWGQSTPQAGAMQGASIGAYIGSVIPGVGTAIGAIAGGILGGIAGSISSGKHQDQKVRDSARDFLQQRGMINEDHQLTLADGSLFDIGVDGGHRFENLDGDSRAAYQTDPSNPLTAQAIAWLDPLSEVLMGGNEKLRSDFTGYFVNAVSSNSSDPIQLRDNVISIYAQAGIPFDGVAEANAQLASNGLIDQNRFESYMLSLESLYSTLGNQVPQGQTTQGMVAQ